LSDQLLHLLFGERLCNCSIIFLELLVAEELSVLERLLDGRFRSSSECSFNSLRHTLRIESRFGGDSPERARSKSGVDSEIVGPCISSTDPLMGQLIADAVTGRLPALIVLAHGFALLFLSREATLLGPADTGDAP